uniref:Uncharacterized protein n=1 Tax=Vespula pensylvanica TaxID=30213 RepID=A0A834P4A6_VESPE|nr:hypothetical protein H0235_007252 [Vespula pensylvanica]
MMNIYEKRLSRMFGMFEQRRNALGILTTVVVMVVEVSSPFIDRNTPPMSAISAAGYPTTLPSFGTLP